MTRNRAGTGLALLVGATVVIAACGSGGPTNTPSQAVTPPPTEPVATGTVPSFGLPGFSFALPSFTSDQELESMFPSEIGGQEVTVLSMSGADFMAFGGSSNPMGPALGQLGKSPSDLSVAIGQTPNGSVRIVAFRIAGIQASQFLAAYTGTAGNVQGTTITDARIGGKAAKKVVTPSETVYLYLSGDVLWTIGGAALSDATLDEAFTKLP
jgi:hypothetical protein